MKGYQKERSKVKRGIEVLGSGSLLNWQQGLLALCRDLGLEVVRQTWYNFRGRDHFKMENFVT